MGIGRAKVIFEKLGISVKDQNGKLGWAWADTRQQAEAAAVAACGNGSCRTETWACTTRY